MSAFQESLLKMFHFVLKNRQNNKIQTLASPSVFKKIHADHFFKNPFNMDTKSHFPRVMSYDKVNRVDCVVGNLVTPKHISYVITKLNNSTNPRGALFLHKK